MTPWLAKRSDARTSMIFLIGLSAGLSAAPADAGAPHWISGPRDAGKAWKFSKAYETKEPIQRAELSLAADFCTAVVTINDQPALTVEPYCPRQTLDVTQYLRRGKNEIVVAASPIEGPAAVAVSLTLHVKDGEPITIVSDEKWTGAESRGPVPPEQWGIDRRSADVSPFDNYEQWRQASGNAGNREPKFWLAPGFEVTRVRQAEPDEGSWIAMAFDAQGRVTISREDNGLLRMTPAADHRSIARVEAINVDLPECRGLVYVDGRLYANANNARGMFRVTIDEEGLAHDLERLREFPGGLGHGRNDLAHGPDGRIYSIHGDSVEAPGVPIVDRTSPLRESRRGTPRQEAYVVRTDSDGKEWELVCTGLRNPYGIAFNQIGDLFTYDADNEFDMGMPWYRPTRIVQIVSGADYGYRKAKGQWPPEFVDHPDNGLPVMDVGRGSPTAVMFGTQLDFPAPYRDALFVLDWAYGRVLAVHLAPRGAGYRGALELFMQGKPLNVTDLAAGPDGALWLITGGRKTRSALYRVARSNAPAEVPATGRHESDAAAFSATKRDARLRLEKFHVSPSASDVKTAWPHLGNEDPLIRHAARIAIEQQPLPEPDAGLDGVPPLCALANNPPALRSRLTFLESIARMRDPERVPKLLEELLALPTTGLNLSDKFVLLFLHSECLAAAPMEVAARSERIVTQLAALWPDPATEGLRVSPFGNSAVLRRRLAFILSQLGDPGLVVRVARSLLPSDVQEDRFMGLLALRNARHGWTADSRKAFFMALRETRQYVGGEGLPSFLDRLKSDTVASLDDKDRSDLEALLAAGATIDEPLPPVRPKVASWNVESLRQVAEQDPPTGDAKRGAAIFREALCSRCHRAGASGPAIGPELTYVARRFGRREILESIIEPSRIVAENYRNVSVATDAGKVYVGRLVSAGDFRGEKLRLNVDPLHPGQIVEIDKKEVAEEKLHDSSPMPQGLLDGFTQAEIADLLAFLETGAAALP